MNPVPQKKEITPTKSPPPPKEVKKEAKIEKREPPPKPKPAITAKKLPDKAPIGKTQNKTAIAPVKNKADEVNQAKNEKIKIEAEKAREADKKLIAEESAKRQRVINENVRQKLAKVQENLAKVEQTGEKIKNAYSISKANVSSATSELKLEIDALPIGTRIPIELSTKEINYRDEISMRVIRELALPEHGSGTIKLTIGRSGKIDRVEVMESASSRNKEFILKNLPNLRFPPFENRFKDSLQYTFIIKFNN